MDLGTMVLITVIGCGTLYGAYHLTRGNPSNEPKPSSASFFRRYQKYLDLRNLKGGTLVKNGVYSKPNGKLDITYKKGFKMHTDYDVPEESVVSYPNGGDFQNGLIIVYPKEELNRVSGNLVKHLIKQNQKLDLQLETNANALLTINEMLENTTDLHKAREAIMRVVIDTEEIRKPLKAETDRARQSLEFTQATPDTKKPESTGGTLGINR